MELIKVVNAKNVLEGFSSNENISPRLSYWMTKFVIRAQPECDFYITEMRKLFDKYDCKQQGDNIVIPTDKIDEFNDDVSMLEHMDVEAPNIKFALSDLSSELKISMRKMATLLDFIDEEK